MGGVDAAGRCPDEGQISAYVEHRLDAEAGHELEAHLDRCETCAAVVADMVRIFADTQNASSSASRDRSVGSLTRADVEWPPEDEGPDLLAPGSAIGRYRTLDCVGIGGMGAVYAAYDPQLDRRVALKLLIEGKNKNPARKRARLLREAQSMAKLAHPNVITVHDVGVWHGQVFVAMEFVEGGTLKTWMRARRRPWSEIRETMLPAGRGLAAAHAAGMVHRDFKPDNVLIGEDGRVRVTDFGLARWEDAASTGHKYFSGSDEVSGSVDDEEEVLSAEVSLTRTGALIGTPAYMAPELYKHEVADAATDQYAFCVALYEAICGQRPFAGHTLAELATSVVSSDPLPFPSDAAVPRFVRNAILRGMSRKRSDRFPSMAALLAALERRSVQRWRTAAVVAIPLTVVALGAWASRGADVSASGCDDAVAPMQAVWNAERRARIEGAFEASDAVLARAASVALVDGVDTYARSWSRTARATCEAARAGGRAMFVELSQRCLARGRVALDVALESFEGVDEGDVARAAGLVDSIARDCGDEEALLSDAPPPVPEVFVDDVERIRLELAKVEGYMVSGRYDAGAALARDLDAQAEILGVEALQAETRLALGQLLDLAGESEAAATAFEEAELLAVASRYHRITAEALVQAVFVEGVILEHHARARTMARRAEAAAKAADLGDAFLVALLMNRASTEFSAADYAAAETYAARALELADRDARPLRWADAAFNLASIRIGRGRHAGAIETLREYIEVFGAEVGHVHPDVATGYHNLSIALNAAGRVEEGEEALRTALDILERTVGEDHPTYAQPLSDLAAFEAGRGRYADAVSLARRSVALRERHGYEPLAAATDRRHIAEWLGWLGRPEEAQAELARAHEDALVAVGPGHPRLAEFRISRAWLAALAGDRATVAAQMAEAADMLEATHGRHSVALWEHRRAHAGMLRRLGNLDDAIETLQALLASTSGDDEGRAAAVRFELARVLAEREPDSDEARRLARVARHGFEAAGATTSVAKVDAWLGDR